MDEPLDLDADPLAVERSLRQVVDERRDRRPVAPVQRAQGDGRVDVTQRGHGPILPDRFGAPVLAECVRGAVVRADNSICDLSTEARSPADLLHGSPLSEEARRAGTGDLVAAVPQAKVELGGGPVEGHIGYAVLAHVFPA